MQKDISAAAIEVTLKKEKQSPKERQETPLARSAIIITSDDKGNLVGAVKIMKEGEGFDINKDFVVSEAKISALMPDRTGKIFYGQRKNENGIYSCLGLKA